MRANEETVLTTWIRGHEGMDRGTYVKEKEMKNLYGQFRRGSKILG